MGPIGWPELIILLVVVLIVFGPGKLPDIGNAIGRGVREFRKASNELKRTLEEEVEQEKKSHGNKKRSFDHDGFDDEPSAPSLPPAQTEPATATPSSSQAEPSGTAEPSSQAHAGEVSPLEPK